MKKQMFNWWRGFAVCLVITGLGFPGLAADAPPQKEEGVKKPEEVKKEEGVGKEEDANGKVKKTEVFDYKIVPLDVITVVVVNEKELSGDFQVKPLGEISYPFLERVKVAGKTASEIETLVKKELEKDYLVNAQVVVHVKEHRKNIVSVIGQVNKPTLVELPAEQPMTIIEAIGAASGFAKSAKDIEVTRPGEEKIYKFKKADLLKNVDPQKAFKLKPGDIINVTETWF
jgi:protein involved in polysaccharide export with SLBB domain